MGLRLFSLLLALCVAASSMGPCTADALARAGDREPEHAHSDALEGAPPCHEPSAAITAQCPCGCADDGARAAASAFASPWALPAPSLARVEDGRVPRSPGRSPRPASRTPSGIEHVPVSA